MNATAGEHQWGEAINMRPLTLSQAWRGFLMDKRASGKSPYTIRNYQNCFNKGYAQVTIRQYIHRGTFDAIKRGKTWFVNRYEVLDYKRRMDEAGSAKYAPA